MLYEKKVQDFYVSHFIFEKQDSLVETVDEVNLVHTELILDEILKVPVVGIDMVDKKSVVVEFIKIISRSKRIHGGARMKKKVMKPEY